MPLRSDSDFHLSRRSCLISWPPFLIISSSCFLLAFITASVLPIQREGVPIQSFRNFVLDCMTEFSKPGKLSNTAVFTEEYDPELKYFNCPVILSGSPRCDRTPRHLPEWCLPAMPTIDGTQVMEMARTINKSGSVTKRSGSQFADCLQPSEVGLFKTLNYYTVCKENVEVSKRIGKKARAGIPEHDLPRQEGLNFSSCAVVASSDKLLNFDHGALIDEHSLVIRLNEAPTLGFERHVGSKTHIRIQNTLRQGFAEGPDEWCLVGGYKNKQTGNCSRVIARSPQFTEYCRYIWEMIPIPDNVSLPLSSNGRPKTKMSGGFLGVTLALHLCNRVSIFGLSQDPDHPDHYFNKTFHKAPMTPSLWSKIHPWELERKCLNILSDELPEQIQIY